MSTGADDGFAEAFSRSLPALQDDPFPHLRRLQQLGVVWSEVDGGHWVVTGYRDVREVLLRADVFSSCRGTISDVRYPHGPDIPIQSEGPEHAAQRRSVVRELTFERQEALRASVPALARELLGGLGPHPVIDLVAGFAEPYARRAFGRYLGLTGTVLDRLAEASGEDQHASLDLAEALSVLRRSRVFEELHVAGADSVEPAGIIDALRSGSDRSEFVRTARFLYAAGVDTVRQELSLMLHNLARFPLLQPLGGQASSRAALVEELLRYDSGIAVVREARRAWQLGGARIRPGDALLVFANAANRDPERFDRAEEVRVDREPPTAHLAFGAGPHRCPGAGVARELLDIALAAVHEELPAFELVADQPPRLTFTPLRQALSLPVRLLASREELSRGAGKRSDQPADGLPERAG